MTATTSVEVDEPMVATAAARPPQRRRWRVALLVVAAVLAGFALRVAIGLTDDAPATDESAYLRSGLSLIDGEGFERGGEPELHFPPFVPFLLGLASHVFADPHTGTVVLTCLSSTAVILPLAYVARRIAGPVACVATAWCAALAPAVSTTLVNQGAGSEAEYTLLVVGAVALVVAGADRAGRARVACIAGAGLLVGLAYLTRPEGLFVAAPLGIGVLALAGRHMRADRRWRSSAALVAAFAMPLMACIAPYAAYLHSHTGEWQLSAKTQDASLEAWHAVARNDRRDRDKVLYALDETGLELTAEPEPLTTLAREDPGGYLGIVGTNVRMVAQNIVNPDGGTYVAWLLLPLPLWLLVGLGTWRLRRSRVVALVVAVGLLPVVTSVIFFAQTRYLILTAALATILVGVGVSTLAPRLHRRVLLGMGALSLVSCVLAFHGTGGWGHPTDHTSQRLAGEWIAGNTDAEDRIMARAMVTEYYSDRSTLAIPYASLADTLRFGRHYGASYITIDHLTARWLRPQLLPLFETDSLPGLDLVHEVAAEGRTSRTFALLPPPPEGRPIGPELGFMGDG